MPIRARDYLQEYAEAWQSRGVRAWNDSWWQMPREVGDMIGRLMNAPADSVAMHLNVTSAYATILSCCNPTDRRNKMVVVDMEFPSTVYLCREWLRGRGQLHVVQSHDSVTIDVQELIDAIDDRTLIVPISHVLFRSSFIMDAKAIIAKAHSVGAMVVLDVFQSLGTVPVDIRALGADFAVGGCLKWLCGGPGACFLYVHPGLQPSLTPRFTGWMAHEQPFGFDTGSIRYTTGSYKFMNGTANIPALYACRAGLEIVTDIGVEAIRERSMFMTLRLIALATDNGWNVNAPRDSSLRAGTVAVDLPNAREIAMELNARDILVDFRPKAGIRLSPHFYNTDDEIDFAISSIKHIVDDGSWKKHASIDRVVT
jgi:kynureninase